MADHSANETLTFERLRECGLLDELARVFRSAAEADLLLDGIRYPAAERPPFAKPITFWRQICVEVANGKTAGGLPALLAQAASSYPDNPFFKTVPRGPYPAEQTASLPTFARMERPQSEHFDRANVRTRGVQRPGEPPLDVQCFDPVFRYLVPYPVAALYRLSRSSHDASARLGNSLRLAEGVLRFLALVNLADAAASQPPREKMEGWLKLLQAPGAGKLLGLLRSTAAFLGEGAFLRELPGLFGTGAWEEAAGRIIEVRNRTTHDDFHLRPAEAAPRLEQIREDLHALLAGVAFLQHYQLGVCQALRRKGKGFAYHWYASRGSEESGDWVTLEGDVGPNTDLVMLIDPRHDRALYLAPFFHWGLTTGDGSEHLTWLQQLEQEGGKRVARYRHPVLRLDSCRRLPDPDDLQGEGITTEDYLDRLGSWPGVVELRLAPGCREVLHGVPRPTSLAERYQVIGKIGEGASGSVWEAVDTQLGRRCAFKVLRNEYVASPQWLRRFQNEGRLLAQVRNPAIVAVYALEYTGEGAPCLVMEFIEGEDLERRLQREGALPLEEAVSVVVELLQILADVHHKGIVHRDIKPSNLIQSPRGLRLVDLGIALGPSGPRLTTSVERVGSVGYMAPEQWSGQATPRSDLYACGRLLCALLSGRAPGIDAEGLNEGGPGVSAALERVYRKATAKEPEARYQSAREMAEMLRGALQTEAPRIPDLIPPRNIPVENQGELDIASRLREITNSIGMKLVLIPAGTFLMGSPEDESERLDSEGPQHEVEISRPFYLGVYPVTQAQWQAVMGINPSWFSATGGGKDDVKGMDTSDFPVEQVSWEDVAIFLKKLAELQKEQQAGRRYRLPSEAEWEYACRGGASTYQVFHFGNSLSSTQANFDGNYPYGADMGPYLERSCKLGSYERNAFGLYDMHGNVWEWCSDWYAADYYGKSPRRDPSGPSEGSDRVLRGGDWGINGRDCRSAHRGWSRPGDRARYYGFRVALVPSEK